MSTSPQTTKSYRPNPGQEAANTLLQGPQRHTLIKGGARSGKTFLICRAIATRAIRASESRHLITRFRNNAVWPSIGLDTLPKVMRICYPQVPYSVNKQMGYFRLANQSEIWLGGLDDKERVEKILGQEYSTVYFNECSQIPYSSVLVARTRLAQTVEGLKQRAYYDLNPTGTGHWTYHEFVQHRDPLSRKEMPAPEDFRYASINPAQNAANLSPEFLKSLEQMPEKQRKRFLEGEYVAEVDGALWTYDLLEKQRVEPDDVPEMSTIVVAVDPSGASGDEDRRSDEIGITVQGLGRDGRGYLLEDGSLRDGPGVWGRRAVDLYHKHKADRIVAEKNFGGEMVRFVIKSADQNVPVMVVTAARGKHVRAEPIATLYEQDKIRHLGRFPDLEDQLVNFSSSGYVGERSPDRADAAIWGFTDLLLGGTGGKVIAPIIFGASD